MVTYFQRKKEIFVKPPDHYWDVHDTQYQLKHTTKNQNNNDNKSNIQQNIKSNCKL